MTTFTTEIETDVPPCLTTSEATATLSEIKSYITQYRCHEIIFGINFEAGFDSLIAVRRLYILMIDGTACIVLTGRSSYPGHIPGRKLSFRHEIVEDLVLHPKTADILALNLPHNTPVFCGVKRSFSDRGPHTLLCNKRFGVEVLFSLGPKNKRKTTWHVNTDILSLWCDSESEEFGQ